MMWGTQLHLSFSVVGNGLSWAMKATVQSSFTAALPHQHEDKYLSGITTAKFFLDTRAYVFDYASGLEGENKR
jgi:hypothetical protein